MELECRPFTKEDLPIISTWWEFHRGKALDYSLLPFDGFVSLKKFGEEDFYPVAAAFLYLSLNSRLAQVGYFVTAPPIVERKYRYLGLRMATESCVASAISKGYKEISAMVDSSGIGGLLEGIGFCKIPDHTLYAIGVTEP